MFARITRYTRKPGTREEATALLEEMRAEIMALPGMIQFTNVMNADGTGCLIALMDTEAQARAHVARSAAIWNRFAHFVQTIPEVQEFEVTSHWVRPD